MSTARVLNRKFGQCKGACDTMSEVGVAEIRLETAHLGRTLVSSEFPVSSSLLDCSSHLKEQTQTKYTPDILASSSKPSHTVNSQFLQLFPILADRHDCLYIVFQNDRQKDECPLKARLKQVGVSEENKECGIARDMVGRSGGSLLDVCDIWLGVKAIDGTAHTLQSEKNLWSRVCWTSGAY